MASLGEEPLRCRLPAMEDEVPLGTQRLRVQDQGEPPRWRTSAVVWHGEGWAEPCDIAQVTLLEDDGHYSNYIHIFFTKIRIRKSTKRKKRN